MSRKHMPLMIGGAVTVVLVAAMAYFLMSARSRYGDAVAKLDGATRRLNQLSGRDVFPSEANVDAMRRQLEVYENYLQDVYESVQPGEAAQETIDRDKFRQLLEQSLRRLVQLARSRSVNIPADLAFGFQRYAAGILPDESELERLVHQVRTIVALCEILFEEGIGELVAVERTAFESDGVGTPQAPLAVPDRRGSRGRGEPVAEVVDPNALFMDPDGLFSKEHYALTYRAQDAQNWQILDRLATGFPFAVVTKMEIVNSARPVVVPPRAEVPPEAAPAPNRPPMQVPGGPAMPGQAPEILPRELRVVAGQELPMVRLEVDVYRFVDPAAQPEAEVEP
jgi:hypothetical protein